MGGHLRSWLRDQKPYRNAHLLRQALDLRGGLAVLDVGGGTGIVEARARMSDAVVVDLDPDHLARAREKGFDAARADAETLPFPDGTFDRVVSVNTLHHLEDPEPVLVEIRRVLDEHGRVVLEEVMPDSLYGRFLQGVEEMGGHPASFLEPREMKELLERIDLHCKVEKWSPRSYAAIAQKNPPARERRPGELA